MDRERYYSVTINGAVMRDQITELCNRLVRTDDPGELRPVAAELQSAIRERVDRVRENAFEVALVSQIVDLHTDGQSSDRRN